MKHTILGAGGSIGNALAFILLKNNQEVRLVSRSKFSIDGAESVKADVTSYAETLESVRHSDVVYLCVGLPYDTKIWRETWPKITQNVIDACKNAGAKLIFFDNVYMYGKVDGKMTETTPYKPVSKKGEIRAEIAVQLEKEIAHKNLTAIIARAADLYGPYATKGSVPYVLAIENLMRGKRAQWLVDVNVPHSYSYTMDCAEGLFLLANDPASFNQVWHLPTHNPGIDGKTFIRLAASEIGVPGKYTVLSKPMIKLVGFFNKPISEIHEMLYQNEYEYYFDSSKFNEFFNYQPKSYTDGIKETIDFFKNYLSENPVKN